MIHEILKILDTTDLQELEKQRITTDLLRLFNVSGQSELLLAFAKWLDEDTIAGLMAEPKYYVERFLKANNSH